MRAEDLITLAGAHGVDADSLRQLALRAKRDVKSKHTHGVNSTVLLEPRANRARGTETPTTVRPEWTLSELGQAAAGVPAVPFMAACYAFAGDRSRFWRLQAALNLEAEVLARHEHWPFEVTDMHGIPRQYLKHLAKLVLDHDANPHLFGLCEPLYAIYMGVAEKTWDKEISQRYEELNLIWLEWLSIAARIMQPRLARDES